MVREAAIHDELLVALKEPLLTVGTMLLECGLSNKNRPNNSFVLVSELAIHHSDKTQRIDLNRVGVMIILLRDGDCHPSNARAPPRRNFVIATCISDL